MADNGSGMNAIIAIVAIVVIIFIAFFAFRALQAQVGTENGVIDVNVNMGSEDSTY